MNIVTLKHEKREDEYQAVEGSIIYQALINKGYKVEVKKDKVEVKKDTKKTQTE